MYLLRVLLGSLDFLCSLWMAKVTSLVLRQLLENCSEIENNINNSSFRPWTTQREHYSQRGRFNHIIIYSSPTFFHLFICLRAILFLIIFFPTISIAMAEQSKFPEQVASSFQFPYRIQPTFLTRFSVTLFSPHARRKPHR